MGKECLTNEYIRRHKNFCCGCHACLNICPARAIQMQMDQEGFLYPVIDEKKCIKCGQCAAVCQMLNSTKSTNGKIREAYAYINPDLEERLDSSSGGIFIQLAKYVIANGGRVFGAAFNDDMNVRHMQATDVAGCRKFMGAKYVQSVIGTTFKDTREALKSGKLVLFTGTPCQIHGLKLFLKRDYDNLITASIVCYGVPSPLIFKKCMMELEHREGSKIKSIRFRDKRKGWQQSYVEYKFENGKIFSGPLAEDIYIKGFFANLYLRPSCHQCINREGNSFSDLTIGDYWGIDKLDPDLNDGKGASIVLIYTDKGKSFFQKATNLKGTRKVDIEGVIQHNPRIINSEKRNRNRNSFFKEFEANDLPVGDLILKFRYTPSHWVRFRDKIRNWFHKV